MKIPDRTRRRGIYNEFGTLLFNQITDYEQEHLLEDPQVEAQMIDLMVQLMKQNDAPTEQFERLGLQALQLLNREGSVFLVLLPSPQRILIAN